MARRFISAAEPAKFTLPEGYEYFMCAPCDEVKPVAEFSHVAGLSGLLVCKACVEIRRNRKRVA